MSNVVAHPHRELMVEAKREREIVDTPKARALQEAIFEAVEAYWKYLNDHGLIMEEDSSSDHYRVKASALMVTVDLPGTIEIWIKNGAADRVFGNGVNPDPDGRGPSDVPH
jgi:hypothetical protein